MRTSQLLIKGQNLESLVAAVKECQLQQLLAGKVYALSSNTVVVTASERFYLQTKANVLSTIVLDFSRQGTCYVDIVCGGGSDWGLGTVSQSHNTLLRFFQEICEAKSWSLEDVTPSR
jgi:hypothetical protein